MIRQVSSGSAGEYQSDEQAVVARFTWRVSEGFRRLHRRPGLGLGLGGHLSGLLGRLLRRRIRLLAAGREGRAQEGRHDRHRNSASLHSWLRRNTLMGSQAPDIERRYPGLVKF